MRRSQKLYLMPLTVLSFCIQGIALGLSFHYIGSVCRFISIFRSEEVLSSKLTQIILPSCTEMPETATYSRVKSICEIMGKSCVLHSLFHRHVHIAM